MTGLLNDRHRDAVDQVEINMVPVMNLFLVLIPFLLMASNFLPFYTVNTSVPINEASTRTELDDPKKKSEVKVTMAIKLNDQGFEVEGMSGELTTEELQPLRISLLKNDSNNQGQYPFKKLSEFLATVKSSFPKSDTIILMPEKTINYKTIIKTMDSVRTQNDISLFPKVVLSNQVS